MVARRGQAQIFTQACLHAGWRNETAAARKGFIMSWIAAGVPGGMDESRISGIRKVYPEVRQRMRPERRHVVMDVDGGEFVHFVSSYEDKWPEIFLPQPAKL